MLHESVLCNAGALPLAGSINEGVPNDLFNVIRSIVSPPPLDEMPFCDANSSVPECTNDLSCLFKRRPTERNLLQRGDNGSSFSAKETEMYLEDLFIYLVEPIKYTDGNKVLDVVLDLMIRWKLDRAVQEQAFKCLMYLSQQCHDLQLPPPTVPTVIKAMECFHRFEMIQRMGVKILKCRTFLDRTQNKVQVAHLIFKSLCNLPEMDDFMLHAKEIVQELTCSERQEIREHQPYVDMLLDFPNCKNDKITVFLSWCALDTLILLAESDKRWDVIFSVNGEDKLKRMSCRPELEDRCQTLLNRIFCTKNKCDTDEIKVTPLKIKPCDPVEIVHQPFIKLTEPPIRDVAEFGYPDQILKTGKVENYHVNQYRGTLLDLQPDNKEIEVLPDDNHDRFKPPTPPPTIPDIDDRIFDEEKDSAESTVSFYTMISPSYSPPPETYALLERRLGPPLSPPPKLDNSKEITNCFINNTENSVYTVTNGNISIKSSTLNGSKSKSLQKSFEKPVQCLFCFEPKAKRPLLVRQYNSISHCLLEPRNSMLFKLIQSNLCDLHKMQ